MKRSILTITLIVASFGFPLLLTSQTAAGNTNPSPPQCETCEIAGGCFICAGGFSGGDSCLAWCDMCTLWGSCEWIGSAKPEPDVSYQPLGRTLKARPQNLRDIAAAEPHLALALMKVSQFPILKESGRMLLSPVSLSEPDTGELVQSGQLGGKTLNRLHAEALEVNSLIQKGKASPLVYSIAIKQVGTEYSILRLRLESGTVAGAVHTTLEMKVTPIEDPSTNAHLWKIKEWSVS
jgi:hypothetical protein